MRHNSKSDIFQAYVNERVTVDVQAAFLERSSKKALIRVFAHMSLTCDPRALINVNAEMLNNLPPDNELRRLMRIRKQLVSDIRTAHGTVIKARGTKLFDRYEHIKGQIFSRKARRRRELGRSQRRAYFRNVGTKEIERQLNNSMDEVEYIEPTVQHEILERRRLVELLCDFRTDLVEEQIVQRRVEIITNMIALCRQSEPQSRKKRVLNLARNLQQTAHLSSSWKGAVLSHSLHHTSLEPEPEMARKLIDLFPLKCREAQCPFCIGDTTKTLAERLYVYSRPSKMMDHVERIHFSYVSPKEPLPCCHPTCSERRLILDDLQHYKNHVAKVHGIVLRA